MIKLHRGEGNIMAEGEEYSMEKRERRSNIIFSKLLKLLGRILGGKKGKRTEIF